MSDTQLHAKDVKNDIKRINMLPPEQREEQLQALLKRVSGEIESTYARIENVQKSAGERRKEVRRLLYCVMAFPKGYRRLIYKEWEETFTEPNGVKLFPYNIEKEVQSLKRLPKHEYEAEMLKLMQDIAEHIDSEISMVSFGGRTKFLRLLETLPLEYGKILKERYWSAFYANMVHVSGLPLPEHAEVKITWQGHELSIISGTKEFVLPIDRIINMGATVDYGYHQTKEYLTIEYEKEGETKNIVIYSDLLGAAAEKFAAEIVKYFDQIKGTREMNKQEL